MSATTPLRLGERLLEIALALDGEHVRATIDGTTHDARRLPSPAPPYTSSGAAVFEIAFVRDGRTRRATVARSRERVLVALDGHTYVFVSGEEAGPHGAAGGTGAIVAPMPGKVIAVLVAVGQRVEHGTPVLVLEAMKMETTLAADVDGEVTRIGAAAGDTVDGGIVLIEITPG